MSKAQISTSRASFGDQTNEDGLSTTSQHQSESSCSNSLSAHFPNRKVPEASKKACLLYNTEEKNIGTVGKSSVCSDISDGLNCTSKTVENVRSYEEHNLPVLHSGEIEIRNQEISREGKNLAEFDLNEDILNIDGSDDFIQPIIGNASSQGVVRVVVKIGVPNGWPKFPLEFAGELGWKGPSKKSAFRSIAISKKSDKKMCFFTGIDLNIAAVEDSSVCNGVISSDLKRAESSNFDLNRLYDDGDDNSHLLDLNLNANTTVKSGNRDLNPLSSDYLPSLSTVPPKFPFLPLQSYPSKGRFHVGLFNPSVAKSNHLEKAFHERCLFLAKNSSMRERLQQESWFRTSNKRKETEGGSEFYQLR